MSKEKLVVVVGPTAVGKTKISIELAKNLGGEIINGDSMQVYNGMDIGTAKITKEETEGIPHHLFNIKEPTESYSAAEFQELAVPLVTEINERGSIPIVVGGTGMYIKALTNKFNFSETDNDPDFRKEMEHFADEYGAAELYDKLNCIDPSSATTIHPNNVRRVIRALEIHHTTGIPASEQRKQEYDSPYRLTTVGLTMERYQLYERINQRVDEMIEKGLINEVRHLVDSGVRDCQSMQAIGYKEIYAYLKGGCSKEDAIDQLKQNSRRYAKKQLTWFRYQMNIHWFDMTKFNAKKKISTILQFVAGTL